MTENLTRKNWRFRRLLRPKPVNAALRKIPYLFTKITSPASLNQTLLKDMIVAPLMKMLTSFMRLA
jgi:hypothetical protein